MTLVLALATFLVASPAVVRSAGSAAVRTDPGDPDPGLPPGESGDPDMPVGPSKNARKGAQHHQTSTRGIRTEGDGRSPSSVVMWRLRVVLQTLRVLYLRF